MHIFNGTPSRGRSALNNAVSSATDNIFAAAGGWLLNLKNQNFKSTYSDSDFYSVGFFTN